MTIWALGFGVMLSNGCGGSASEFGVEVASKDCDVGDVAAIVK